MTTEETPKLLTFQGAKSEVMNRTWREIEEETSHGRVLTSEDNKNMMRKHWQQVKREIQALKQKGELSKHADPVMERESI